MATTAPSSSVVAASHPRFPGSGQRKAAGAEAAGGRTVPRGWAQPPQGPSERRPRIPRPVTETPPGLGRHIPRRTPPRKHALERPPQPRSPLMPMGRVSPPQFHPVLPGLSVSHRQLPPRPQCVWACAPAPPTPLTRPRPARLSSSRRASRRARTHLPRPLMPSPGRPRPTPPPHVTPLERRACACADTPRFLHPRVAPPPFSFLTLRPCYELFLTVSLRF